MSGEALENRQWTKNPDCDSVAQVGPDNSQPIGEDKESRQRERLGNGRFRTSAAQLPQIGVAPIKGNCELP